MKTLVAYQILLLLALTGFCLPAVAQDGKLSAHYHIALPLGRFDNFQQNNSYSGFSVDYYYRFPKNVHIGGMFGWQLFHKTFPKATYQLDEGAITMKQWRYTHVVPIALGARYSFLNDRRLTPYVGFANGIYLVRQEVWAGLDQYVDEKWRYGFHPEAGIHLKVVDAFGFTFGTKYHFIVHGQRFSENDNLHFWDFNFGVYLKTGSTMEEPEMRDIGTY